MTREYNVKHEVLVSSHQAVIKLAKISKMPQHKNMHADSPVPLAVILILPRESSKHIIIRSRNFLCRKNSIESRRQIGLSIESREWRFQFKDYALYGMLSENHKKKEKSGTKDIPW